MLTNSENKLNTLCVHTLSKANIFPVKIDVQSGKISVLKGRSLKLWLLYVFITEIQLLYATYRLYSRVESKGFGALPLIPLFYLLSFAGHNGLFMGLRAFYKNPEMTELIINSSVSNSSSSRSSYRSLTYVELLTMSMPLAMFPAALAMWVAVTVLDTAALPGVENSADLTFWIHVILDGAGIFFWVSWAYFSFLIQLLFLGKVDFILQDLLRRSKSNYKTRLGSLKMVKSVTKSLREVQLSLTLFNEAFSKIIFTTKVACIGIVTICGFGAVEFLHRQRALAVFNLLFAIDALVVFNVLYDRGFAVPRCIKRTKSLLLGKLKILAGHYDGRAVDEARRKVLPIRNIGIRVGSFHHLQRVSTPTFVDFCLKNTARLVMAFNKR